MEFGSFGEIDTYRIYSVNNHYHHRIEYKVTISKPICELRRSVLSVCFDDNSNQTSRPRTIKLLREVMRIALGTNIAISVHGRATLALM